MTAVATDVEVLAGLDFSFAPRCEARACKSRDMCPGPAEFFATLACGCSAYVCLPYWQLWVAHLRTYLPGTILRCPDCHETRSVLEEERDSRFVPIFGT